jgi:hypothetical protein
VTRAWSQQQHSAIGVLRKREREAPAQDLQGRLSAEALHVRLTRRQRAVTQGKAGRPKSITDAIAMRECGGLAGAGPCRWISDSRSSALGCQIQIDETLREVFRAIIDQAARGHR